MLSSFNVLGSGHTAPGGNKPGWDSGVVRIRRVARLLTDHHVSVVGFQELEDDQLREFNRVAGGSYDVHPGFALGMAETRNSLVWSTAMWKLVRAETIGIPYFDGNIRRMPYVLLRHRSSGLEAWFANFHNPASTSRVGDQSRWRERAAALEVALARRLNRDRGRPVFFTGDMNSREDYFCHMTGGAPMIAADGGSNSGVCRPPQPSRIDWIFGSRGVVFNGYVADVSERVRRTSDHPMIRSGVTVVR